MGYCSNFLFTFDIKKKKKTLKNLFLKLGYFIFSTW